MDQIYELKDQTKLLLYTYLHSVYTYSLPVKNNTGSMSVASDYESMLESCIFDSTVYFVYQNTTRNIVMSNLLFHNPHVVFNDEAGLYAPLIHGLFALSEDHLCMTVSVRNPVDQNYAVEIWSLRPEFKRLILTTRFPAPADIRMTIFGEDLFLFEKSSEIYQVLQINKQKLLQEFKKTNEEIIDLPDIYQRLKTTPLFAESLSSECPGCKQKDLQITALTRQYNELVETAKQIQSEGLLWKRRFQKSKNKAAKKA